MVKKFIIGLIVVGMAGAIGYYYFKKAKAKEETPKEEKPEERKKLPQEVIEEGSIFPFKPPMEEIKPPPSPPPSAPSEGIFFKLPLQPPTLPPIPSPPQTPPPSPPPQPNYDIHLTVKKGVNFELRFYYYHRFDPEKCNLDPSKIVSHTIVKKESGTLYDFYSIKINIPPSGKTTGDDAIMEIITDGKVSSSYPPGKTPICRKGWVFSTRANYLYPESYTIWKD
jgi:hypothetical protein